jgi:hypothetical protein
MVRRGRCNENRGPARDWLLTAEERAFVTEKATRCRLGFALQLKLGSSQNLFESVR